MVFNLVPSFANPYVVKWKKDNEGKKGVRKIHTYIHTHIVFKI